MTNGMNRRGFLRTSAGGALAISGLSGLGLLAPDPAYAAVAPKPKPKPSPKPTLVKPRIPSLYRDSRGKAHSRAYLGLFDAGSTPGVSVPETLEAKIGRKVAINHCFRQPPDAPWAPYRARMLADKKAGRIPMLSYAGGEKPGITDHDEAALARLKEIASGARDKQIDGQALALKALATPVFFRFTWEFDIRYLGPAAVKVHKAAWRRVHKRFKALGATNVAFVWCPSWLAFGNGRAAAFYPGDTYVDWIGVDGYARSPDYRTFYQLFASASGFALKHRKPLMVCETGVHRLSHQQNAKSSTSQSTWIDGLRSDLSRGRFSNVKALLYFHVDGDNHPLPNQWRLNHPISGPAFRSFKSLAHHPRLKAVP